MEEEEIPRTDDWSKCCQEREIGERNGETGLSGKGKDQLQEEIKTPVIEKEKREATQNKERYWKRWISSQKKCDLKSCSACYCLTVSLVIC